MSRALSRPPRALPRLSSSTRKAVSSRNRSARPSLVGGWPPARSIAVTWAPVIPTARANVATSPPNSRTGRLASAACRARRSSRPLRQVAREQRRLGALARPLLGHAAADLGVRGRGLRRALLRRLGRRAARARPRRGPRRPAPALHRRGRPRLREVRGGDAPGRVGDRHLVRQRRDALRAVPLPLRERGRVRGAIPRRLHLRGDRPDPRLVLHAAGRVDPALRHLELPQLRLPRPDPRPRGPEDVEEQGQRGRPLGCDRGPWRRRLPLVLPDLPAAMVRLPLLRRHGRRIGAPIPAHALEHLLVLGALRERRGPWARGTSPRRRR